MAFSVNIRVRGRLAPPVVSRATVVLLIVAQLCLSSCGGVSPQTNQLTLTYIERSDERVSIALSNGTAVEVSVRGSYTLSTSIDFWEGDYEVVCETTTFTRRDEQPFGSAHGNPHTFSVLPGESKSLVIRTTLPKKYVGGICKVRLLVGGRIVGPVEFAP